MCVKLKVHRFENLVRNCKSESEPMVFASVQRNIYSRGVYLFYLFVYNTCFLTIIEKEGAFHLKALFEKFVIRLSD